MQIESTPDVKTFYHASKQYYEINSTIGPIPDDETGHHVGRGQEDAQRAAAEDALERCRLDRGIKRDKAIFLFEKLEHSLAYGDEELSKDYFIYTVSACSGRGVPMALSDRVYAYCRRQLDAAVIDAVSEEYWMPTKHWCFLEFLCRSCVVLSRGNRVDIAVDPLSPCYIAAKCCYARDSRECDREYGRLHH